MTKSVVFLGSKPGAVVALERMIKRSWDIKCVVIPSRYDQSWMPAPSLEDCAKSNSIEVVYDQNDLVGHKADFVVSYMYRNLVKQSTLDIAKIAAVNFHSGPLPEYGGFAFYNIAILEGASQYGCTCHHMDTGFDTGNLIKVNRFSISSESETAYSLEKKTQSEMLCLFDWFLGEAESNSSLPSIPQQKQKMRYLDKDSFEALKVIDLADKYDEIQRKARAFWYPPYDCAYFITEDGLKVQIIPDIARHNIAEALHVDDYRRLSASK